MSESDLACVFGTAIQKVCPVQTALAQPNIQKYKQASDPAVQQAKEFGEAMTANMTFLPLPQFCAVCPHLHRYNMQQATEK